MTENAAPTTDQKPTKKPRKPRATSKYIVVNVLELPKTPKPEHEDTIVDFCDLLGLKLSDFEPIVGATTPKRQLAIIEGDPQNGIIQAREYVESNGVAGKRILIACVRRDGESQPISGVKTKGL